MNTVLQVCGAVVGLGVFALVGNWFVDRRIAVRDQRERERNLQRLRTGARAGLLPVAGEDAAGRADERRNDD